MGKQKQTSKTYVHLPDGRMLPVSTVHDAGGAEMQIERHLPCEQWEQMVQKMMERAGEVMSTATARRWAGDNASVRTILSL